MNAVAQHLADAASELAAANAKPMQIRAIDATMDKLIEDEDLGTVLQAIVRVCKSRMRRDDRARLTSGTSWETAMDSIEAVAIELSELDFEGEKIEEPPPCRGCRTGSPICTC